MRYQENELKDIWKTEEEMAHIKGWNFSHIHGRYEEENDLPWNYKDVLRQYLREDADILDYDTGGGEFLLSLNHPFHRTAATEGYQPNVELCREKLLPLGIRRIFYCCRNSLIGAGYGVEYIDVTLSGKTDFCHSLKHLAMICVLCWIYAIVRKYARNAIRYACTTEFTPMPLQLVNLIIIVLNGSPYIFSISTKRCWINTAVRFGGVFFVQRLVIC